MTWFTLISPLEIIIVAIALVGLGLTLVYWADAGETRSAARELEAENENLAIEAGLALRSATYRVLAKICFSAVSVYWLITPGTFLERTDMPSITASAVILAAFLLLDAETWDTIQTRRCQLRRYTHRLQIEIHDLRTGHSSITVQALPGREGDEVGGARREDPSQPSADG